MTKPILLVLLCAVGFIAGVVAPSLVSTIKFTWNPNIDVGTIFNILSAVATSIAAVAALRSAQFAERMTVSSQADARMQIYAAHQQQFDRVLDDAAKEMRIAFFRRVHLYDRLFPANRHLDKKFTAEGHQATFNDWLAQYTECEKLVASELPPSPEYIHDWMKKCLTLANSMNFTFPQLGEGDGEILWDGSIYTSFARDAGKPFYFLGEVLHRLASFGLLEQPHPMPANEWRFPAFFAAYGRYYEDIAQGWTPHRLS